MDIEEVIRALPKLEQHVHIVGSTSPETLLWIIKDSGVNCTLKNIEDARKFYRYKDFDHFISVYSTVNDYITDEKYYEKITYEMLESDARCNVKHVEAIFSANDHVRRGLDYGKVLDNINRGIRRAESDFDTSCTIRIDLVRNYGPKIGMQVLDWIEEKGENVVAIDIGGTEKGYPPQDYKLVYKRARDMGLHLVAHAGEAAGVDSVWGAVDVLEVERIGHGVIAASDHALLKALKDKGITIETCPISNLRTGAVKLIKDHPIRTFIKEGINVSVNSDDPPMFDTDMNKEYLALHRELGFTTEELFKISLDSVKSSFLDGKSKKKLKQKFEQEYLKLIE